MAGVGIAFNNDPHGQNRLDAAETAFADDGFCRQQRTQTTAFLRIWRLPEAVAFKNWISS